MIVAKYFFLILAKDLYREILYSFEGRNRLSCANICVLKGTCSSFYYKANNTCLLYGKKASSSQGNAKYLKGSTDDKSLWKKRNGKQYLYVAEVKAPSEAQIFCRMRGTELAKIESSKQQIFVKSFLRGMEQFWLGGRFDVREKEWRWPDGSVVSFDGWSSGSMRNEESLMFCMEQSYFGWDCSFCNLMQPFLCEKSTPRKTLVFTKI